MIRTRVPQCTACTNRLAAPGVEPVQACLEAVRDCLDQQIRSLGAALAATIARAEAVLRSISGVGPTTAAALSALMPELGQRNRRQARVPRRPRTHPKQSGARDAYRRTRGGRATIKPALFWAAQTAARHNPTLKAAYTRLKQAGKKPIVAITAITAITAIMAIMRRIVVIANARLRDARCCPTHN